MHCKLTKGIGPPGLHSFIASNFRTLYECISTVSDDSYDFIIEDDLTIVDYRIWKSKI